MSDFDTVLERLLSEPAFAAALAADPAGTLAGYRLDPDEVALLHTQVGVDPGGQSGVEVRANQSSLFGMLAPLTGLAEALPGFGGSGGSTAAAGATGMGPAGDGMAGMGGREPIQGMGPRPDSVQGMGSAGGGDPGSGASSGLGEALAATTGTGPVGSGLAEALAATTGTGPAGGGLEGVPEGAEPVVPDGYRTRVDVDGDGEWDRHELHGRADGGVDILVDTDGDGTVDFVGHDLDADGLVDVSEYDRDGDGFFERRMYDDDGDGWMDRSVRADPPTAP